MLAKSQGGLLQVDPPAMEDTDAKRIARDFYGLGVRATRLTAERDLNFLLTGDDGTKCVLKIANAGELREVLDFQISALKHLAGKDIAGMVPEVMATIAGNAMIGVVDRSDRPHFVYMLSFLEGTPMAAQDSLQGSEEAGHCIGALLGRLDRALADFQHPAQQRRLPWDLSLAAELRPKLVLVEDKEIRSLAIEALDRFERTALPRLHALPRQVIHNDLNPHNLISNRVAPPELTGVIDFGDMLEGPRANDVAVAASYHFRSGLDAPAAMVAAYNTLFPLTEEEIELVPVLIGARSVLTVAISTWRAQHYPENRAYIQRNRPAAVRALAALSGDGPMRLHQRIRSLCQRNASSRD